MTQLTSTSLTVRAEPAPPSGASLALTVTTAPDIVAPAGVFLKAVPSGFPVADVQPGRVYDPSFHDVHYRWEMGDPGDYLAPVNLPAEWRDRNVKYGRNVSHVFRSPGTYTARCTAIHGASGTTATQTVEITVADPDVLYAGSRTILVDPAGTGDPATYPGSQIVTTLDAALTAARGLGQSGRILLLRDTVYADEVSLRSGYPGHLLIGAYGDGAAPVLNGETVAASPLWVRDCDAPLTISDLDVQGSWDPTTETGTAFEGIRIDPSYAGGVATIFGCRFSGRGLCLYPVGTPGTVIIEEVTCDGWADYGLFGHVVGNLGIAGCTFAQKPLALAGGKNKSEPITHNQHGPIRLSDCSNTVYLGQLDLFSKNGWLANIGSGLPAHQPCLRWNQTGARGGEGYVDRVVMEGGFQPLAIATQDTLHPTNPGNLIVDKVLLIATAATTAHLVRVDQGGTTLRNVVGIAPDVRDYGGTRVGWFVETDPVPGGVGNADEPVALHGCTFVNLGSDVLPLAKPTYEPGGYFADYREADLVLHQPAATPPQTADAPLDATPLGGVVRRYVSFQWQDAPTPDPSYATPSGSVADFRPQAGSAAIGDATGQSPQDDFYGAVRGASPSRGAVEPS